MTTVSSLSSSSSTDTTSTTHKTTLDQSDFISILLAQLQYQDPNDPVDDKEMAAQLTQFSSLEALTNINEGIQSLVEASSDKSLLSGSNYLGKSIKSTGYNLTVSDGTVSTLYYSLGESVSNVTASVYDTSGDLVSSVSLGSKGVGEYSYVWDGKNTSGNTVSDGTYGIILRAENSAGETVVVQSQISGVVSGVKTTDGTVYLELSDGRTVDLSNVTEIVTTASTTSSSS